MEGKEKLTLFEKVSCISFAGVVVLALTIAISMLATEERLYRMQNEMNDLKTENAYMRGMLEKEEKTAVSEEKTPDSEIFYLTAYCSCEECCGEWSKKRPKDKFGNEIVYGASGEELIPGYSIAVDPAVIPLGSIVKIDGKEYRADDTGGAIKGNRIDVYFSNHEDALKFNAGEYKVEVVKQ